jgi:predicted transcriptional regulator
MNMGDLIRKYRLELGLSQQELGQRLEPKVQNSCVAKWEKGRVDNIKRSHIKQMAEMFGISPVELLCFDDTPVSILVSPTDAQLLSAFRSLDELDKGQVLGVVKALLMQDKYKKESVVG